MNWKIWLCNKKLVGGIFNFKCELKKGHSGLHYNKKGPHCMVSWKERETE